MKVTRLISARFTNLSPKCSVTMVGYYVFCGSLLVVGEVSYDMKAHWLLRNLHILEIHLFTQLSMQSVVLMAHFILFF
jgi:hypothetical protein